MDTFLLDDRKFCRCSRAIKPAEGIARTRPRKAVIGGKETFSRLGWGLGSLPAEKSINPLPKQTWTCPHCGFVHHAADIVRLDDARLRCKQCGKAITPQSG